MPELPEVETIRRSLVPVVLHKPIEAAEIHYAGIVRQMGVEALQAALVGNQFVDLSRRGKYLLFQLADHRELVAHLRMTGRLIYFSDRKIPRAKHTSAVFDFGGQGQLRLEDVRKFATLDLVPRGNYEQIKGLFNLGVEPLSAEFSLQLFRELLQGRTAKIKGLLLDQSKLAGLGNIYADESLFAAGIHPERPAGSLTKKEERRLYASIRAVLTEAIANQGTTFRDYRTGYGQEGSFQNKLRIYGKKGELCPRCQTAVEHMKVAGRTSHYCPNCQKE
ncbi:MAG TPA: DNA-formamidopyrimidine glycosylase [Firmicutes bacterium]|nr:DNA-formamidopyrimidine glycosylase [Bacillota bacterium]